MKRIAILMLQLFWLVNIQANAQQGVASVSGKVTNKQGVPVDYATVALESATTTTQIYGEVTNASGDFKINQVPLGKYTLSVRCMGYVPKQQECLLTGNQVLPTIILDEDVNKLSEVVIVASYTKIKPTGEISVRLQGNPISEGKSLMEVLRYVQGVEVFNSDILVNGKEGTLIYLGDRQITLEEFKSIPPSMLKSIDVIPNAGVSFGKEARGGVIRVTLREQNGIIGSLELSTQADKIGWVDGLLSSAIQYQRGKFTIYNNLNAGLGEYRSRYERQDKYLAETTTKYIAEDKKDRSIIDNIGMQYQLSPKQTIDLYGGLHLAKNDTHQFNKTNNNPSFAMSTDRSFYEISAGLLYKLGLAIGEGASFSTRMEYLTQKTSDENVYLLGQENKSQLNQRLGYAKIEPRFDLQLNGGHEVRAGVRYHQVGDNNDMNGINNPLLPGLKTRKFEIKGTDLSPWLEYSKLVGERLYLQAGLRYQAANLKYADRLYPDASYKILFSGLYPSVQVQYMISPEKQSGLSLSYRKDFSLPNYGYYSPIAIYQTEHLYSIGNQRLKQERFDIGELSYYINRMWTLTYRLRYGRDIIHIMTHQDPNKPNLIYTQPENIGSLYQNYLSVSYTHRPVAGWHTNNRLFVRNNNESMPERSINNTAIGWSSTQQVRIKKNIGITASFSGETKRKRLSYEAGSVYGLDAGAYMTLLNNSMYINLSVINIIHSKNEIRIKSSFADMQRIDLSPLTRIKLSISWSFSSGDKINEHDRDAVNAPQRKKPTL